MHDKIQGKVDDEVASRVAALETSSPVIEILGLADFSAVDVEAPIADTRKICCKWLGILYQAAGEIAKDEGSETASRVYRLLSAVTQIHFKPRDCAEPYGPDTAWGGRRSLIPDDLRGEQSTIFAKIAPTLKNAGLRARLADIAWFNNRQLAPSAQLAIKSYCDMVRLVRDGRAELFFEEAKADSHNAADILRRACQIASATGWTTPEAAELKALISSIAKGAYEKRNARGYLNIGEVDVDYRITDAGTIAARAEELAKTDGLSPETLRRLLDLAARVPQQVF